MRRATIDWRYMLFYLGVQKQGSPACGKNTFWASILESFWTTFAENLPRQKKNQRKHVGKMEQPAWNMEDDHLAAAAWVWNVSLGWANLERSSRWVSSTWEVILNLMEMRKLDWEVNLMDVRNLDVVEGRRLVAWGCASRRIIQHVRTRVSHGTRSPGIRKHKKRPKIHVLKNSVHAVSYPRA